MTPEELSEIERRAERATEGPWKAVHQTTFGNTPIGCGYVQGPEIGRYQTIQYSCRGINADIDFIAAARTDVPALCQAVRVAEAKVTALRNAIGEMVPTILRCYYATCSPNDKEVVSQTLRRVEAAMKTTEPSLRDRP